MADQPITREKLINADKDVQVIEDFIKKPKNETVTTRFGDQIMTLKGLEDEVKKSGGYFKRYATLAAANADIANIPVNSVVKVTDAVDGGDYEKAAAGATNLTKSPFDPLEQAKGYTDDQIALIPIEQINLDDYSVVIKDKNGVPAVGVLLDKNGKPSIYMLNSIFEGLAQKIGDEIVLKIGEIGVSVKPTQNGSFFVVDKNDQLSWFGVDENGLLPDYTVKCILDAIQNSGYSLVPSVVKSTYQDTEIKAVSGANINCIGDSMTAGAGGGGTSYSSVLQTLLLGVGSTASVYNSGVGGETSVTITARVGGYPIMVRVTGGIIPATTTATNVTFDQVNGVSIAPLVQGTGGGFSGTFAGVQGNFSLSSGQYRFTRATAGAEVAVGRPTPYINDYAKARRGDITIIWIGQNGPSTERAIQDAKAIIQSMRALDKRYLVISKPTATPVDDAAFFAEFGDRFIAAKKYMVEFGIHDALALGLVTEVTAQDLTDISNYTIPLPLCASTSDRLHWSAAGYTVFAHLIFKKLKFLGWI